MDYMEIEKDYFRPFITHSKGLLSYIEEMRQDGKWGGDIELQILSEIYDVKIEVYNHSYKPVKVFNENASQQSEKIVRLLYLQFSHYDSLHFLKEKKCVIEGAFGTLERIVLDGARERVKEGGGRKVGEEGFERGDVDRVCKKKFFFFY